MNKKNEEHVLNKFKCERYMLIFFEYCTFKLNFLQYKNNEEKSC